VFLQWMKVTEHALKRKTTLLTEAERIRRVGSCPSELAGDLVPP
jgi:hypothetical protein